MEACKGFPGRAIRKNNDSEVVQLPPHKDFISEVSEGNEAQQVIMPTAQISDVNRTFFFFFQGKTCLK